MRSEIEAEVRDNVARLVSHPQPRALERQQREPLGLLGLGAGRSGSTAGRGAPGYYYDLLPALVAELDATRPYTPGSPYSPDAGRHPNDPAPRHDAHLGRLEPARLHGLPRLPAPLRLRVRLAGPTDLVDPDPRRPRRSADARVAGGARCTRRPTEGNGKLDRGLAPHLPQPVGMEDWHWAMQLNQARAVRFGLEHFRSLAPHCMGAVVWQLNDCWPVTSWAAVDGDGRRKPLWYAMRDAYAPRLLTVQPRRRASRSSRATTRPNRGRARWSSSDGASTDGCSPPRRCPCPWTHGARTPSSCRRT